MDTRVLDDDVGFAMAASELAAAIVRDEFRSGGCAAESKSDGSPVSVTDLRVEDELRAMVKRERPRDAFLGEERGETLGDASVPSARRWVVDPIDGTKSFMRGVPLFGCMIGLQIAGENRLGLVAFPAISDGEHRGQTYVGIAPARGSASGRALATGGDGRSSAAADASDEGGCWMIRGSSVPGSRVWSRADVRARGEPCRVTGRRELAGATVCVTDPRAMLVNNGSWLARLSAELGDRGVLRSWGDCFGHAMVASGRADVMIDSPMKIWDIAAIEPLVLGAGGVMSDWLGGPAGDGSRGVISAASEELLARVIAGRA